MRAIVAIGGGSIGGLETFAIDEYIVKISGKKCPKTLFIPTASGESQGYIDVFNNVYGKKLGCITDTLLLIDEKLTDQEIKDKILSSDIIYVGGGDTKKMLAIWRKYKVDEYLKQVYEKGSILSGLSAGAMCWFKYGHSDSGCNEDGSVDYICLEGLGFVNAILCPHYNEEGRKTFDGMMSAIRETGIALENNCAVVFMDDAFRIIKSDENASAYKFCNSSGKVEKLTLINDDFVRINELTEDCNFRSLNDLIQISIE